MPGEQLQEMVEICYTCAWSWETARVRRRIQTNLEAPTSVQLWCCPNQSLNEIHCETPTFAMMDSIITGNKRGRRRFNMRSSHCACWQQRMNPFRYGPVRIACMVLGWLLAVAVGGVLWRSSLNSKKQELQLKCENRVEVSKLYLHDLLLNNWELVQAKKKKKRKTLGCGPSVLLNIELGFDEVQELEKN